MHAGLLVFVLSRALAASELTPDAGAELLEPTDAGEALVTNVADAGISDAPIATPLFDPSPTVAPKEANQPRGLWVGDSWRYQQRQTFGPWLRDFLLRIGADLLAMPASVVRWDVADYLALGTGIAVPIAFSVPVNGRSADSRLMLWIHKTRGGPNCGYAMPDSAFCPAAPTPPRFWTLASDNTIMAVTMGVPVLALGISALVDGAEPMVEASALAIEAFAVTQVYHIGLKLLTGREGPLSRDGRGEYFGPTQLRFPDGTPSGHSATIFAIAGTYALYFTNPFVRIALLASASVAAAFLVVDDSHYASEVIVGSAMGLLIAKWVVEHRSSRYRYGDKGMPVSLLGVAPAPVAGQGAGLAVTFAF